MTTPVPTELLTAFRSMDEVVYAGESYDSVYDALCRSAVQLISGCDHASLMLRRRGRTFTVASSDSTALQVDELEKQLEQGPCLDAMDEAEPDQHLCADLTSGSQWPVLAERILEQTSVRGMAGFRLLVGDQKTGALNLFCDRPGGLDAASVDQGIVLASFVTVALLAAHERQAAGTLRAGLTSNREIGKAVGLLMAFHKITDVEAFSMLRKASQDMNIKLAEVARQVVEHHNRA